MPAPLASTIPSAAVALPPEVEAVLRNFRTAECTTLARDGTPMTLQASPLWQPGRGQFLLTTSIGAPNKALNARRNPRVALLFSNPTGSGLPNPPAVLVQGTARVSELAVWDEELAEFWPWMSGRQPASKMYSASAPMRWLMDWYYMRLKIQITPHRVRWWPRGDMAQPPHELPLSGPRPERSPGADLSRLAPNTDAGAWKQTTRALGRFPTVVLSASDPAGDPASTRCVPRLDAGEQVVRLDLPEWLDAQPGPACLMSHRHDAHLWALDGFLVRGVLHRDAAGWRFRPTRYVTTMSDSPLQALRTIVSMRRQAGRYLTRRGLARPRVPWDLVAAAKHAEPDGMLRQ